ncbi:hypothetical protein [Cohaesibacter intestini]|uniref:hypothetical protein n=1 Tax=Cohaesibacter intestini TaxID=2211145 RepID=UPI000DEA96B2|nr:hypothetical protein [Cohaesibacter intestini]
MDTRPTRPFRRIDEKELRRMMKGAPVRYIGLGTPMALIALWWNRIRERRQMARDLQTFPPEVLEDFNMTRESALKLVNKPFWRA